MRKLSIATGNGRFYFVFQQGETELKFDLTLEEVGALDAGINTLSKLGVLTENPIIRDTIFSLDVDLLFKKIDEKFPEFREKKLPLKDVGGHYV